MLVIFITVQRTAQMPLEFSPRLELIEDGWKFYSHDSGGHF